MKFSIAYDLKPHESTADHGPDDQYEEFDSPVTIRAIGNVLRELGHEVCDAGDGKALIESLLHNRPDFVFNLAEGSGTARSREARVPALCEMLEIPHTGSDPLTLAVALEKDLTRRLVEDAGVMVPKGITLPPPQLPYNGDLAEFLPLLEEAGLTLPVIAKPVFEGSSKGVRNRCLVERAEDFGGILVELWTNYGQSVLVEEFITGDEATVGIIGNDPPEVFGVMKITPKRPVEKFVYSLEVKRDYLAQVDYECPARFPTEVMRDIETAALTVFDTLGCRDLARLDFRIRDGVPYFIEINPLPGLNPESSDLVIMAGLLGVTYSELIARIVNAATARYGIE